MKRELALQAMLRERLKKNQQRRNAVALTGGDEFQQFVKSADRGLALSDLDEFQECFISLSPSQFAYVLPELLWLIVQDPQGAGGSQGVFAFWSAVAHPGFLAETSAIDVDDKKSILEVLEFLLNEKSEIGIVANQDAKRIFRKFQHIE